MGSFKSSRFFYFLRNMYYFLSGETSRKLIELEEEQIRLKKELNSLKRKEILHLNILRDEILQYYATHSDIASCYNLELQFLKENKQFNAFPYKKINSFFCESFIDESTQLKYVLHKGKKLFFPREYSLDFVKSMYENYISEECILGGDYKEKQPHQYESPTFYVDNSDVLVDVGGAEALFTLDHIDVVKKAYVIESDTLWIEVLKNTFAPYKDKVVIVQTLISDADTSTTKTLSSILKLENAEKLFIKMDIEGYEYQTLQSSLDFLSTKQCVKIACCTYHYQDDYEKISNLFKKYNYTCELSEGYMLFPRKDDLNPPYFRHGLIRATLIPNQSK